VVSLRQDCRRNRIFIPGPSSEYFEILARGRARYSFLPGATGPSKACDLYDRQILDVVVDLRVDSPTFGQWEGVELLSSDRNAVLLPIGVGHAFVALEDDTTVCYLVSDVFTPDKEFGVHPLDADLAIDFGVDADELLLSPKDQAAPSLSEALAEGLLPHVNDLEPVK